MSRICYIYPEEGIQIRGELSLEEVINQHPEVKQVVLFWVWDSYYYTSDAAIFEGYVNEKNLDLEYSIYADREDALKFAEGYDCWDGHDFAILNGDTLYGYVEERDEERSWHDGYDHMPGLTSGIDPRWIRAIVINTDYETGDR